ncbi:MAG: hypothetical protein ABSG89_12375 [Bacteroidales bacterium]|jgi:hypothetical protein
MEIEKFSVRELTVSEQMEINGGTTKLGEILADIWDGIKSFADWLWDHLKVTVQIDCGKDVQVNVGNR